MGLRDSIAAGARYDYEDPDYCKYCRRKDTDYETCRMCAEMHSR